MQTLILLLLVVFAVPCLFPFSHLNPPSCYLWGKLCTHKVKASGEQPEHSGGDSDSHGGIFFCY